jgi:uroporphyrinogen decarboxylase
MKHLETMTSKERFLAALRNEVPDRVPVAPDISNYIPAKRTGLPFWEIYFEGKVPLWQAYLEAADYYGADAWVAPVMGLPLIYADARTEWQHELVYDPGRDAMLRRSVVHTPDGDLTQEETCFRGDPPTPTLKLVKNLVTDLKKLRWVRSIPTGLDRPMLEMLRTACEHRDYAFGVTIGYPGFQSWMYVVQGGVQPLVYAEADNPEILEAWLEWDMERGTREMELALQADLDYILLGGSGTITLASPRLAAKYALPALKKWSRMAKEAGVPTMLHSCGKNRILADMLATETDVGMLNPLEVPPMGDIDLAEVKRAHGQRLALMGNLHTTDVMLRGTPELVTQKAIEAMRAAGPGGGFILSTGDQCGRETPDENLLALVRAAKQFGRYDRASGALPDLPEEEGRTP